MARNCVGIVYRVEILKKADLWIGEQKGRLAAIAVIYEAGARRVREDAACSVRGFGNLLPGNDVRIRKLSSRRLKRIVGHGQSSGSQGKTGRQENQSQAAVLFQFHRMVRAMD